MRFKVLAVRDNKLDMYLTPMFLHSLGQAQRMFGDEINSDVAGSGMNKHPEDFELFYLGDFLAETGVFEMLDRPRSVITGDSVKMAVAKTITLQRTGS